MASTYEIQPYTNLMAYKYGVKVIPSKNLKKKIDVLDFNNTYICSVGDIRYKDFPTFFKERGAEYAEKRRDLYHRRHSKHKDKIGTKSYYASRLLW
jgi:hypothetical protein